VSQPRLIAEPVATVSGEGQAANGSARPPRHIAIIMDGNGRWARARGLPRTVGHNSGAEAVRQAVKGAVACGVEYLTLFGFSSENWKRPTAEIDDLMGLLKLYLRREIEELHQNGVRMQVIGDRSRLGADVVALIEAAEAKTAANKKLTLTIALSYGARAEIVLAARRLAEAVQRGELSPDQIDEARFERFLFTADMPDPDLLIRTSGEKRISNFLLWQCAYAEFVFLEKHWPDFGQDDLKSAIAEYLGRNRRYGASE
jgi:undecaprenyl diphosphate synthase